MITELIRKLYPCEETVLRSKTKWGRVILARLMSRKIEYPGPGNPVDHVGTALQMARKYGIEISPGLSHLVCRAYLPAGKWKADPITNYRPAGDWVEREDIRDAICECIISCKDIGIL